MKFSSAVATWNALCMVLMCHHPVMGKFEFIEKQNGEAGATVPTSFVLPEGTTTIVGNVFGKHDAADCYQYNTNKRSSGYVMFYKKPSDLRLKFTGRVVEGDSFQGSCNSMSSGVDAYCVQTVFLPGKTNICVQFNGALKPYQEYQMDVYPPSIGPPLVVWNESSRDDFGDDYHPTGGHLLPKGTNTIVGTFAGVKEGDDPWRDGDHKDCFKYFLPRPQKGGIVLKKSPPGAFISSPYELIPGEHIRELDSTSSVGNCPNGTKFAPAVGNETACRFVQFGVRNRFCIYWSGSSNETQPYEIFLTVPAFP